jgi:hypothetical protein
VKVTESNLKVLTVPDDGLYQASRDIESHLK